MPDFLDAKVKEIDERLRELRPLVDEFHRLEAARNALSGVADGARTTRRRGRRGGGGGRRGRRGGATRANQALELVRTRPGITIRELAEAMNIQPNYLYRVLPQLEQEGKVSRKGKGWHPAGAPS